MAYLNLAESWQGTYRRKTSCPGVVQAVLQSMRICCTSKLHTALRVLLGTELTVLD